MPPTHPNRASFDVRRPPHQMPTARLIAQPAGSAARPKILETMRQPTATTVAVDHPVPAKELNVSEWGDPHGSCPSRFNSLGICEPKQARQSLKVLPATGALFSFKKTPHAKAILGLVIAGDRAATTLIIIILPLIIIIVILRSQHSTQNTASDASSQKCSTQCPTP